MGERSEQLYQVKQKDTLISIAFKFGMSVSVIQRINGIDNDHFLYPGKILKVLACSDDPELYKQNQKSTPELEKPKLVQKTPISRKTIIKHNVKVSPEQIIDVKSHRRSKSGDLNFQQIKHYEIIGQTEPKIIQNESKIPSQRNMSIRNLQQLVNHSRDNFMQVLKAKQRSILPDSNLIPSERAKSIQFGPDVDARQTQQSRFSQHVSEEETSLNQKIIKTEAYYCTMLGDVKGLLTITSYLVMFDPLDCTQNSLNQVCDCLSKFHMCIDMNDVTDCQQIQLPNKLAADFQELALREAYMFDYYLNFSVVNVNGHLQRRKKKRRIKLQDGVQIVEQLNTDPIANVFFRFSHRNRLGQILMNTKQKSIVSKLAVKVSKYIEQSKDQQVKFSSTLIPFYDPILHDHSMAVQYAPSIQNYVKHIEFFNGCIPDKSLPEDIRLNKRVNISIPHVNPQVLIQSQVLQIQNVLQIALNLPPLIKLKNWKLLYSKDRDGTSFKSFYRLVQGEDDTLIVIQDTNRNKFGAFCSGGEWKIRPFFYGSGQTFLYKFDQNEHIKIFKWSAKNEFFRHSFKDSFGLGGSGVSKNPEANTSKGYGLFVGDGFHFGKSSYCETFENQCLSEDQLFEIRRFEIWGFKFF